MSSDHPLHILFFPFMAQGHILPSIDMARLFVARGVKATIVTTPANAPLFQPSIDRANQAAGTHNPIQLTLIPFPSGTGLPKGCENLASVPEHLIAAFFSALPMLRQPFAEIVGELLPDCVVSGVFFPWTYDVTAELGVPRLAFYGSSFFSRCVTHSLDRHKTLDSLPDHEANSIVIPGLPHKIEMLKSQLSDHKKASPFLVDLIHQVYESESKSYGLVANSFYELEPDYADYCRNVIGTRAWHVGPVSLCNEDTADKSRRGNMAAIDHDDCMKWLDSKSPGSVVYVCFGSGINGFTAAQLRELALGLDASDHPFVWVVKTAGDEIMPQGLEERMEGRGLVIRGWAPQMLILNHVSVGGFLTHCGWNSSLEGISAGLPLITWPLFADQFNNEKLIVDVLKIGIAVGVKEYTWVPEERTLVEAASVAEAVNGLMGGGEEAEERRRKAKELGELAKTAMDEGGSSNTDMSNLIQGLKELRKRSSKDERH